MQHRFSVAHVARDLARILANDAIAVYVGYATLDIAWPLGGTLGQYPAVHVAAEQRSAVADRLEVQPPAVDLVVTGRYATLIDSFTTRCRAALARVDDALDWSAFRAWLLTQPPTAAWDLRSTTADPLCAYLADVVALAVLSLPGEIEVTLPGDLAEAGSTFIPIPDAIAAPLDAAWDDQSRRRAVSTDAITLLAYLNGQDDDDADQD